MLDYKLIEAMAVVIQEGGFDRAAQVLHLTQSAVSQRVKLLEEQTGQVLMARTSPPVPTSAGKQLLRHYLQVKQLEDDLSESFIYSKKDSFISLAIGINADSLATWFFKAVYPFLEKEHVLLDLRIDDQEETFRMLRNGEVTGCISTKVQPIQGCRIDFLGAMNYRLVAAPDFAGQWFPQGLTKESLKKAPAVIFNRKDKLHSKMIEQIFDKNFNQIPAHYIPSSEKFADLIVSGFAYGMLPDWQTLPLLQSGRIIDIAHPYFVSAALYWHCWNLKSRLLENFSGNLVKNAHLFLTQD
ncbi:LysR family transcriptional regulator ArgP [Desulfobacterales bacterium HSG17]|nr:LysR family transcriptional regulator ArgP [Desulfobacterales bacterium HSG17]